MALLSPANAGKIRVPVVPAGYPHPHQHAAHWDTHRFVWLLGGIGSGKTEFGAVWLGEELDRCGPKSVGLIVAPTYGMIRIASMPKFLKCWEPMIDSVNNSEFVIRLKTGQIVYLRSTERPDLIRGIGPHAVWCDEAAQLTREAYEIAIGRLVHTGGRALFTTTPNGYNYVWEIYTDTSPAREHHGFHRFSSIDNPGADKDLLEAVRVSYTPEMARQEIDAEFCAPGIGRVYADFDRAKNAVTPIRYDPRLELYGSLDFGYRNPAAQMLQVDSEGTIRVLGEFVERNVSVDAVGCWFLKQQQKYETTIEMIYCDPAGDAQNPQTLMSDVIALRNVGLPLKYTTRPRDRSREAGEDRVRAALFHRDGRPRVLIDPDCRKTIAAFEGFMFERDESGKPPARVGKKDGVHDHPMDAFRYFVVNHFPLYRDVPGLVPLGVRA